MEIEKARRIIKEYFIENYSRIIVTNKTKKSKFIFKKNKTKKKKYFIIIIWIIYIIKYMC